MSRSTCTRCGTDSEGDGCPVCHPIPVFTVRAETPPTAYPSLTVDLGGFKEYRFTLGDRSVTLTPEQVFEALQQYSDEPDAIDRFLQDYQREKDAL